MKREQYVAILLCIWFVGFIIIYEITNEISWLLLMATLILYIALFVETSKQDKVTRRSK